MRNAMIGTLAALLGGVVLSSCSKSGEAPTATESAGKALGLDGKPEVTLEDRFADYSKDLAVDGEGNVGKEDCKGSHFEGKQLTNIGGAMGNKEFAATRYSKKNWQGTKNFDREKFAKSKSRWDDQEWFLRKQAQEAGAAARNQGQAYATSSYQTSNAREQSRSQLSKPTDLKTEIRQRTAPKPLIMDNEDYEKMSLNDSKRLLGRD